MPDDVHVSSKFSGKVSLLVVDDEPAIREVCAMSAGAIGLFTHPAATAREGLDLMKRVPIDIVLTDLCLPDLSGVDLIQQFRKVNPNVVVIMMSGYVSIETVVEGRQQAADYFLSKPFCLGELKTKLAKIAEQCVANTKANGHA